jgi:hypothetical protein
VVFILQRSLPFLFSPTFLLGHVSCTMCVGVVHRDISIYACSALWSLHPITLWVPHSPLRNICLTVCLFIVCFSGFHYDFSLHAHNVLWSYSPLVEQKFSNPVEFQSLTTLMYFYWGKGVLLHCPGYQPGFRDSSDPPASTSRVAGTVGEPPHTQFITYIFIF